MAKDRWPELCQSVAHDDVLPVRDSGIWTEEKLYFWHKYIDMATTSMVGKRSWPEGVCYLDLLAGPGICVDKVTHKRFPGSVLIAANALKPFTRISACEMVKANACALEQRLKKTPNAQVCKVFQGDCNKLIDSMLAEVPARGALTLAFIDNEGLNVPMETLRRLGSRRADLLILFPDAVDILRNVDRHVQNANSELDSFLGNGSNWRDGWHALGDQSGARGRDYFTKVYVEQLQKHLGLSHVEHKPMWGKGPLYRLIYASSHPLGLKFWREAASKSVDGQKELFPLSLLRQFEYGLEDYPKIHRELLNSLTL